MTTYIYVNQKLIVMKILKIYHYDCSSYDLLDVEVKVLETVELCKLEWIKLMYDLYLENEEFIEFEEFKLMDFGYDNYEYEIVDQN
jgi:hypothetical protein